MKKTVKILSIVLALVLVVGLFAACGGDAGTDEPVNDEPVVTMNTEDGGGMDLSGGEITEETKFKDDLTMAIGDFATSNPLNPAFILAGCNGIVTMVWDSLLRRDADLVNQPCLATEVTTEDYITWHVKLREGVKWHDGGDFTAADVEFTFDYIMSTPGAVAQQKWGCIDHCEIFDDHTMDIVLKYPNVDFDTYMVEPLCSGIYSKAAVEADPENGMMIGTGPWVYEEAIPGNYLKLSANENYWGEKVNAKTLTMKVVLEQSVITMMFLNGELDWCGATVDELPNFEGVEGIEQVTYVTSNTLYLAFNMCNPLMSDINFRKAVAHAIDPEVCTQVCSQGYAVTHDSAAYWGGRTDYKNPNLPFWEQDLDKAKEYLAASAYNGETVQIMASIPGFTIPVAEVFQEQLEAIGMVVEVDQPDNASLTARTLPGEAGWHMMINSGPWNNLASSCDLFFMKGMFANKANWENPRVQELLVQAGGTPNGPEREALYFEIQEICAEEIPFIGINNGQAFSFRYEGVGGMIYFADGYPDYSHVYRIIEE